jgi:hypothetical protein
MSDPTPTDVQRYDVQGYDFDTVEHPDGSFVYYEDVQAALTALRLDVQRITDERDRALAQSAAEAKQFQEAAEMAGALAEAETDRDAQVREAFLAGYRGSVGVTGFDAEAEREYTAWIALRERQDGKEQAK